MLTLLHHNISVCAQKVRLALYEKGLPWEGREIDLMKQEHLTPEFLRINPKGLVPVLIHDDTPICESTVILEYIEDVFPSSPLRPASALGKARMRTWTKIPDEGLHVACASVTYASAFVHQLRSNHDRHEWEERLKKLPDRARAARQRKILEQEFEAPFVKDAVLLHDKVLREMNDALDASLWLAGDEFTLADIAIVPYVTRLDRLGLEGMWAALPNVKSWFDRVQARPSFDLAVTAFRSNSYDDELKKQGVDVWPQVAALLEA
ncbi:glutathione S-transferase family protein [Pusillimonas caeni]|uniref:glutathione S-transferase family protein n=1 Tax=Pusillimonas caeni TaxID=1348472 RepID=UPI000E59DB49|nr:glutathione S-transferase family protein [Pusillimonas caeni]TFL14247.1 glutathione S-transferase family protein [Pusillimonas caeni]